jgi:hypothetical protein
MGYNEIDRKWLDALKILYSVDKAVLPFWKNQDGSVDAVLTLTKFLTLQNIKIGVDGRIIPPA